MLSRRTCGIAAASILASMTGNADPGPGIPASCRALLASAVSADSSATAEAAIAEAWAEIVLHSRSPELEEWSLSALQQEALPGQSAWVQRFNPPTALLDGAGRDGLSQLEDIVSLLLREKTITDSALIREIDSRAETQAMERKRNRRTQKENSQERRTARDYVRVVPTAVGIRTPVLRLKSGGLAIAGGHHLVIVDSNGSNPRKIDMPYTYAHTLVQQSDGRITIGSNEGFVQSFDEFGNSAGHIMLPGYSVAGLLALKNGGFVSANNFGAVTFVDPDDQIITVADADGTVSGTPIQLGNSNVVVTDHTGCVSFFSEKGEHLGKTCTGFSIEGSALELSNGNVLAVNGRGLASVFQNDGTLIRQVSLESSTATPVQFRDGTIALPTSERGLLFLNESGDPTGHSYDPGSPIVSPLSIFREESLVFSTQDGNIHLIDETGAVRFQLRRPETIYAPLFAGDDGALIAGSDKGALLFIDIDGLRTLGL